ncbi:MAG: hypothetical protein J7K62_00805 [Thermoplasmata archaeon]|nr:hypothetical protein [Thermoplasmata archaeon]
MEMKHISVLFSAIGIVLLFFLSLLAKPVYIDLSEINKYDGKQIITEGIVIDKYETKYRNTILSLVKTLSDNNVVTTFVEEQIKNIEYGDRIRLQGEVRKYKGDFEIYVSEAKQIEIIEKWNNRTIPLRILAETPWRYQGINLKIVCKIEKIYHSYLVLKDAKENQKIILFCDLDKINETLQEGDIVYANAKIKYNSADFNYFLEATNNNSIQRLEE